LSLIYNIIIPSHKKHHCCLKGQFLPQHFKCTDGRKVSALDVHLTHKWGRAIEYHLGYMMIITILLFVFLTLWLFLLLVYFCARSQLHKYAFIVYYSFARTLIFVYKFSFSLLFTNTSKMFILLHSNGLFKLKTFKSHNNQEGYRNVYYVWLK
jgi:hypothetical protein